MSNQLPVLVSVGQFTNQSDAIKDILCPADLAAIAVGKCLDNINNSDLSFAVDTVMTCRLFADGIPRYKAVFGGSNNLPRSISSRVGINPKTAIYAEVGGQSPQQLVNEQCERIHYGASKAGLVIGTEAIKATKLATSHGVELNWHETVDGQLDDRGLGDRGITSYEAKYDIGIPVQTYSLFEHALRCENGETTQQHKHRMAELFAPFSKVAASNPFSQFPIERSIDELRFPSDDNYVLTDIYSKYLVAQDAVDQAGAILIVAENLADEWKIPDANRVYLKGYSCVSDVPVVERPELQRSRAMQLAAELALDSANYKIGDIDFFDLYSCFPSAVFCAQKEISLQEVQSGRLTLTGGLPFFGGAGNSYSIHGIIEMINVLRKHPRCHGMVLANGGCMTKEAVGIYTSERPLEWQPAHSNAAQIKINTDKKPLVIEEYTGNGLIENYTEVYARGKPSFAYIIGKTGQDSRFLAVAAKGDTETLNELVTREAIGRTVSVQHNYDYGMNYFRFS